MRINVVYDNEANWLKIPVTSQTPHKRINTFIILDTGSPNTLINYTDSRRLNIPFSDQYGKASIGGNKYKSYSYNRLEILFKTVEGGVVRECSPIKILRPSFKSKELEELDALPNILGLDFLKQGWRFFCDLKNNKMFFEKD